jgi:hypothetical protein
MSLVVVGAVELWKTRRGFSKPCGKAARGRLSTFRFVELWTEKVPGAL